MFAQGLESEIATHEPMFARVANTAQHMVQQQHYAARDVEARADELMRDVQQLKDVATQRHNKLLDAVESQTVSTSEVISIDSILVLY